MNTFNKENKLDNRQLDKILMETSEEYEIYLKLAELVNNNQIEHIETGKNDWSRPVSLSLDN